MKFFRQMTFARFVILFCLLGAIPLAWMAWSQYQEKSELKVALEPRGKVETLVDQIQKLALTHNQLVRQVDGDQLVGQATPESYIREQAIAKNVELGGIDIVPSQKPIGGGVVDENYRVTPRERDRQYSRFRISNFLYMLESKSPRVKVTDLEITNAARNVAPEDVPEDTWKFEAQITTRTRE